MEGGQVNHSWCMGVVIIPIVGLVGAWMEVMIGMHAGQSHEGLVAFFEMPEHFPRNR